MTQEKEISEKPRVAVYRNKEYSITMATSWKVKIISENQTFFIGPDVGNTKVGFYITSIPKEGKTYKDAAKRMKNAQMSEQNHTIIEEQDISQQNFKAFMRRSSWYIPDKNIVLFVRDVFTESDSKVFILSSSIPNSESIKEIDATISIMMTSFKFHN